MRARTTCTRSSSARISQVYLPLHEREVNQPPFLPRGLMKKILPGEAVTYDDVLLVPAKSSVLPREVDVRTRLTRTIEMNIPLVSAAMDTVTESAMAIAMAREGGIGVVHKNMPIDRQTAEVDRVKRREAGRLMGRFRTSGVPIVDDAGRLVGIITNRDLQFERELDRPIRAAMTKDRRPPRPPPPPPRRGGRDPPQPRHA